jgi:hypothetical protein
MIRHFGCQIVRGFSGFSQSRMPHIEQQQQAAGRKKKALVNLILVV